MMIRSEHHAFAITGNCINGHHCFNTTKGRQLDIVGPGWKETSPAIKYYWQTIAPETDQTSGPLERYQLRGLGNTQANWFLPQINYEIEKAGEGERDGI